MTTASIRELETAHVNSGFSHRISTPQLGPVRLAGTSVAVIVDVDVNRVIEVAAELDRLLLSEGVPCNHLSQCQHLAPA